MIFRIYFIKTLLRIFFFFFLLNYYGWSAVLNADLDASYDKEESFYKDEDLESPRARAC